MLYKTICQHLLEDRPKLYESLKKRRMVPVTIDRLAEDLKESHESYKAWLTRCKPGVSPQQISSEAAELALKDLMDSLPPESDETDT